MKHSHTISSFGKSISLAGLFTLLISCSMPSQSEIEKMAGGPNQNAIIVGATSWAVPISITPSAITVSVNSVTTFSVLNGTKPYTFSIAAGGGTIDPVTGAYTAPANAGIATVRVTDAGTPLGIAEATVRINNIAGGGSTLQISPFSVTIPTLTTHTFSATGGASPYTFSILNGGGTVNGSTGVYTAPSMVGNSTVRVTDSLGNTSDSGVNISQSLTINPSSASIVASGSKTFSASGGVGSYTYSVYSGDGQIGLTTGLFTAPSSAGSSVVKVTDSNGNTAFSNVTTYAPLTITPVSLNLLVNGTNTFNATGGVSPYSYSIHSGSGTIIDTTGVYTASALPGTAIVRVTDAAGNTSDSSITVIQPLTLNPSTTSMLASGTKSFYAQGGTGGYNYSVLSGGGSIDSSGLFTALSSAGTSVIKVVDGVGNTAFSTVSIYAPLAISSALVNLTTNGNYSFTASGGVFPYTYSMTGGGSVNSSGVYTAPGMINSATVQVSDSVGNTSSATVLVSLPLSMSPSVAQVQTSGSLNVYAQGGVGNYTYSMHSGPGTINFSGVYTATSSAGIAMVKVVDANGNSAYSSITVYAPLAISPATISMAMNNTYTFTASGGVPPYSYSIPVGSGTITSATGVFTAPGTSITTSVVRCTDSVGNKSDSTVTTNPLPTISPSPFTMMTGGTKTFTASGGSGNFTWAMVSGIGSIDPITGGFTASNTNGTVTIRATDNLNNSATSTITVNSSLSISPATKTLLINSTSQTYSATGGVPPYSFSVVSAGGGTIDGNTGAFTAPASAGGPYTIRVSDSLGNTSNSTLNVIASSNLAVSPNVIGMMVNSTQTFVASGGTAPYTFAVTSGTGTINGTTGVFTAPASAETDTISVTDATNYTITAKIGVYNPAAISGLQMWYDTSSLVGYTNGDLVGNWTDRSGNNCNTTQPLSTKTPSYRTNAINGKPTLRFDPTVSTDQNLAVSNSTCLSAFNNVPGITAFVVHAWVWNGGIYNSTYNGGSVIITANNSANWRFYLGNQGYPSSYRQLITRRQDADSISTLNGTQAVGHQFSIETGVMDYVNQTQSLYGNGSLIGQATAVLSTGNTSATNSTGIYLGGWEGKNFAAGDIAEVLIYNRALLASERLAVEAYLGDKYGLNANNSLWQTNSGYNASLQSLVTNNKKITKQEADNLYKIGIDFYPEVHLDASQIKGVSNGFASWSQYTGGWTDALGGYNAAAEGSPTYTIGSVNGLPSVRFAQGSGFNGFISSGTNRSAYSRFMVFRADPSSNGTLTALMSNSDGNGYICTRVEVNSTGGTISSHSGLHTNMNVTSTVTANPNNFSLIDLVNQGTTRSLTFNGTNSNTVTWLPSTQTSNYTSGRWGGNGAAIGNGFCGANSTLSGDLVEYIGYPYSLSSTQRDAVRTYLREKYNLW